MDLERIREWLIQQGIPDWELDEFKESAITRDVGRAITLSMMNDDALGLDIFALMMRIEELEQRVEQLEGGVK